MSMLIRQGQFNKSVDLSATAKSYLTGQVVGVPTKLADAVLDHGAMGVITSLCLFDKENKKIAVDLYFFRQMPTSQGADGSAFALSAAEVIHILGRVAVATADYSASTIVAEATKANLQIGIAGQTGGQEGVVGQGSKDIYVLAVARGGLTFSSIGSLHLRTTIQQY